MHAVYSNGLVHTLTPGNNQSLVLPVTEQLHGRHLEVDALFKDRPKVVAQIF